METRNETIHEQGKLKRKLGLGAALAVAVGTTIGSGIFSSLAEVAGASGSALMMIHTQKTGRRYSYCNGTYQYVLETNRTDIEGSRLFCFRCQCDANSRFQ